MSKRKALAVRRLVDQLLFELESSIGNASAIWSFGYLA
jgi:hypothetical protein